MTTEQLVLGTVSQLPVSGMPDLLLVRRLYNWLVRNHDKKLPLPVSTLPIRQETLKGSPLYLTASATHHGGCMDDQAVQTLSAMPC